MTKRSIRDLREEMRAVARGERAPSPLPEKAPDRATGVIGVLTSSNRALMQLIAVEKPASVSKLAELSGRTQSNVSRALQDLAKHGLVRLIRDGMTVRPVLAAVEVDVNLVNGTCEIIPVATAAE